MENDLSTLKRLILDKTQGTPFFIEEIVQELREQGVLPLGAHGRAPLPQDLHIPMTVQAVLAARIDRLAPDEKALLQQLAVIGRQFPLSLIRQVISQPETDLYRLLASLQHKEFLYEQPAFPETEYIFKHALTQEVAYGTVLQEQWKVLHERTGQAMEALYQENLEDHYSDLAHHYSRSGNTEKAVEYLNVAGQQAVQRSANADAVTHLTTALAFLQTLPDGQERAEQELQIQLTLGPALLATTSFTAPELEHTYTRALELSRRIGNTMQLSAALLGISLVYRSKGEFQTAREIGEQLVELAGETQSSSLKIEAHLALALPLVLQGELLKGRTNLEKTIDLYDLQQHASLRFLSGQDPGVFGRCLAAYALWTLGYPEQARQKIQDAVALAREISHPFSIATALALAAGLPVASWSYSLAQEYAEAALTLSAEHEFTWWHAMGTIFRGWTRAVQGQPDVGITQIQQGLEAYLAIRGTGTWWPYYLALLAEAYGKSDQADEGLRALAEALVTVHKTEERWIEAELYRLKGELTLQKQRKVESQQVESEKSQVPRIQAAADAEACFLKAIDIAQKQHAKSWELRAVTSLARLWQSQGRTSEARDLLAPVYDWFTEGFDTADLKDAKALLDELA